MAAITPPQGAEEFVETEVFEKESPKTKKAGTGGDQGEASLETLTSVCAASIIPKRIKWFWPNHYALGKVGVLGGHPDEGKTLCLLDMIGSATTGADWPCNEGKAPLGNVILLTAEDDLDDTVIPRLIAAGADLKRVHIVRMIIKHGGPGRAFSLLTDLAMLEQKIAQIGNSVTNAMLRFSDSLAFVAAARHAFVITRSEDDDGMRLFLKAKNNLAAESKGLSYRIHSAVIGYDDEGAFDAPCIKWGVQHVTLTANEALERAANKEKGDRKSSKTSAKDNCIEFLKIELAGGPVDAAEV